MSEAVIKIMASSGFFVAGTDTGVGKTQVACALVKALRAHGKSVAVAKPIAAGAELVEGVLQNEDARALMKASANGQRYPEVNPVCLAEPVAPHLAAERAGRHLSVAELMQLLQPALNFQADALVVEGAGGWRVPLGADGDMQTLAQQLGFPVILVVGMKLGCLNHALLTADAIRASSLPLAGWVANEAESGMALFDENVATLKSSLPAPCLGIFRHSAGLADELSSRMAVEMQAVLSELKQ